MYADAEDYKPPYYYQEVQKHLTTEQIKKIRQQVMDYKVLRIDSLPVNWYEEKKKGAGKGKDDKDTLYRSYVWLQRKEDFVMPVDVEIKFENGEKLREHWDGVTRWTRLGPYDKKTKIASAENFTTITSIKVARTAPAILFHSKESIRSAPPCSRA